MMQNSSEDMLGFCAAINLRYIQKICGKLIQQNGGELDIPENIHRLMLTARTVHRRFQSGDLRHEPNEAKELKELGDWLVRQHRILNNQEDADRLTFEFVPQDLSRAIPLKPESYKLACQQLATQW